MSLRKVQNRLMTYPDIARFSQARAKAQRRSAVLPEMPSAVAASSALNPAK